MLKKLILGLIFLIGVTGFSKKVTITILATTDTHGNLTSYDYLKKEELPYGFLQISTLIKQMRKTKDNIVLVDCGDSLSGFPIMDYYYKAGEKETVPSVSVMNYLEYDVVVPGNHDFDFGKNFFEKAAQQSKFKWVSANILTDKGMEYIYPYSIVEREGVRVGVFGLTTPFTGASQPPQNISGLKFGDLTEYAKKVVEMLKKEKVDLIVGLVHAGLGEENSKEQMLENACYQIAENVKGIDVMLFGHTHKEVSYKTVGDTLLCQPGNYGKSLGVVLVDLQQRDGKWEILTKSSTLLPSTGIKPDKKVLKQIKYAVKGVEKFLNQKIGSFSQDVVFTNTPLNPGNGFDIYYKAVSAFAKPDVLMLPIPVPDSKLAVQGETIRVRDLYKMSYYDNYLVLFQLTGEEIKSLMEFTTAMLNKDGTVKSYYPLYNCDSFYNVKANVDLAKNYGERVEIIFLSFIISLIVMPF
jgi:2',3'-cyclic-nucleotide 2'-phosphodiesterase/3'-nucleotidase